MVKKYTLYDFDSRESWLVYAQDDAAALLSLSRLAKKDGVTVFDKYIRHFSNLNLFVINKYPDNVS